MIEVIRQMPVPKNVAEVRSFLGMINYYGSFVAEMRHLRAPLAALLKKNVPFKWNEECEAASTRAKEVLTSDLLLTHFDPSLDIIVVADASDHEIGAVILHRMPDGTEKSAAEEESRKDEKVSQVIWMLQPGTWLSKPKEQINSWKALSHALSVQNGCLYFDHRIVVSASLQEAVLKQLHEGHPGMTKMKMLARGYVYWTNINRKLYATAATVKKLRRCKRRQFSILGPLRRNRETEFKSAMRDY
ncbi:hypothetical protein NECAME_10588 [Necator americanus]|uniref:RNA-directed DNA polymerase n=1 Tax=Necator americanus TaxID=51031 RepID=W2T7W5_NECAM|nr:hypothetical protein NECAME_10588 [Necator americanus]ETN78110.1 hypothetical protein NECAME_10588 [Necator americanus]